MTSRSNTAPSGNFFPVSVLVSLIVLIGTFFAVLQTANIPLLPSLSRAAAKAPLFRGLVYLPQFRFLPLFKTTPPDFPATAQDESQMPQAELMDRWNPFITEAAQRFSIPEKWIRTIIQIESGGRTMLLGRPITSGAGAMGVMQLMGDTYKEMSAQNDLGSDPYDVHDNIMAGTAYLRQLYDRYGYPRLFAAYNAGPGTLEAHMTRGKSLPAETRNYVRMAVTGTASPWSIKAILARFLGSPKPAKQVVKAVMVKPVKAVMVTKTSAKLGPLKLVAKKASAHQRHGATKLVAARQVHVAAVARTHTKANGAAQVKAKRHLAAAA